MAVIHQATLRPTKLELLTSWLPDRAWYTGTAEALESVATFRFDDPAGAVGIETFLVRSGDGPVHQVPLTYRGAPLDGGDEYLLGTMEHSVLGRRWIYDGTGDPVYAAMLASAVLQGTGQAEQVASVDGRLEPLEPSMRIVSTATAGASVPESVSIEQVAGGDPTVIVTDAAELSVVRHLDCDLDLPGEVLTATWPGQATPVPLASGVLRD